MVEPQLLLGFNFIYTMLMDIITLSVIASDVSLRLSQSQTWRLHVGTIGADRGSRGLCTFRIFIGMLSSLSGSVLEWWQSGFIKLTFIFVCLYVSLVNNSSLTPQPNEELYLRYPFGSVLQRNCARSISDTYLRKIFMVEKHCSILVAWLP